MMTREEEIARRVQLVAAYGVRNAQAIVHAQANPEIRAPALSNCLGMIENESHGYNEFGGEGTACPTAWREGPVTRFRYTVYKIRRGLGFSNNGVGPTQLTSTSYQQEAERRGGCWIPLHNCEVGFQLLGTLLRAVSDPADGFAAYNGSGPAADAYGARAVEYATIWHYRFLRHGLAQVTS
jgi:hypothetical protein